MAIINRLETVVVNNVRRRQPRRRLFSFYGLLLVIAKAAKRFTRTASPRTINACLFLTAVGVLAIAFFLWLSPYRYERAAGTDQQRILWAIQQATDDAEQGRSDTLDAIEEAKQENLRAVEEARQQAEETLNAIRRYR
jgi:hypothetical protein